MLHIVIGGEGDLENITETEESVFNWVVPKSAEVGDELLMYFQHTQSIIFSAEVISIPERATLGKRQVYRSIIKITQSFDPALSLEEMKVLLPNWAWLNYPRNYTTPSDDVVEKLYELALQRIFTSDEQAMPEEVDASSEYTEGSVKQVLVNRYERDSRAREACIDHYGSKCVVCGFDFGKVYGKEHEGFIHVHHIVPLADVGKEYEVDPIRDMRPVCPNCHAVIHSKNPPHLPEKLAKLFRK